MGLFFIATISTAAPAPAQNLNVVGYWENVMPWPLQAVHMIVLKNGYVLAFDFPEPPDIINPPTRCLLFDPSGGMSGRSADMRCDAVETRSRCTSGLAFAEHAIRR